MYHNSTFLYDKIPTDTPVFQDVWLSSNVEECNFDESTREWTMKVNHNGRQRTLIGNHIVLAIGSGGSRPLMPHYPGMENFKGRVIHSVQWQNAKQWKGKKAIVVGTANTGHDMAENLEGAGADVTMVQRERTCKSSFAITTESFH